MDMVGVRKDICLQSDKHTVAPVPFGIAFVQAIGICFSWGPYIDLRKNSLGTVHLGVDGY